MTPESRADAFDPRRVPLETRWHDFVAHLRTRLRCQSVVALLDARDERAGLAVWRLDRLGRLPKHLIEPMAELAAERIELQSVTESIDTTTSGGKLLFHIFGALAEFERNLIPERTHARLAAVTARGRKGGRRKKLGDKQRAVAVDLYRQKNHAIDEICKAVGISRPTLYKYVAAAGDR